MSNINDLNNNSNDTFNKNLAIDIGLRLKNSRLKQNKSLNMIASRIKIREPYLTAIENGNWEELPPGLNGRGLVRIYAKELQVPIPELEVKEKLTDFLSGSSNTSQSSKTNSNNTKIDNDNVKSVPRINIRNIINNNDYSTNKSPVVTTKNQNTHDIVTPDVMSLLGISLDSDGKNEDIPENLQNKNTKNSLPDRNEKTDITPITAPIEAINSPKIQERINETSLSEDAPKITKIENTFDSNNYQTLNEQSSQDSDYKMERVSFKKYIPIILISTFLILIFVWLIKRNINAEVKTTSLEHDLINVPTVIASVNAIEENNLEKPTVVSEKENSNSGITPIEITQNGSNISTAAPTSIPTQISSVVKITPTITAVSSAIPKVNPVVEVTPSLDTSSQASSKLEKQAVLIITKQVGLKVYVDSKQIYSGTKEPGELNIRFKKYAEIYVDDASNAKLLYDGWNHGVLGNQGRKRRIVLNSSTFTENEPDRLQN